MTSVALGEKHLIPPQWSSIHEVNLNGWSRLLYLVEEEKPMVTEEKEEEEEDQKNAGNLLDNLFKKTKTIPCLYWLPLTDEQVCLSQYQPCMLHCCISLASLSFSVFVRTWDGK